MTRINATTQSPIPSREAVSSEELSPISPLILETAFSNSERQRSIFLGTGEAEGLSLPCVSTSDVIRVSYTNAPNGKHHRFFQRHTPSSTEIFPSDMGVEVADSARTNSGPRTPTFQRRGRFLIWPAGCGQDQVVPMGTRA